MNLESLIVVWLVLFMGFMACCLALVFVVLNKIDKG
jgi:hypothetical protein